MARQVKNISSRERGRGSIHDTSFSDQKYQQKLPILRSSTPNLLPYKFVSFILINNSSLSYSLKLRKLCPRQVIQDLLEKQIAVVT
jgi:hypothetical protein